MKCKEKQQHRVGLIISLDGTHTWQRWRRVNELSTLAANFGHAAVRAAVAEDTARSKGVQMQRHSSQRSPQ